MSWKRVFPIASVIAVGAAVFTLRVAAATPVPVTHRTIARDHAAVMKKLNSLSGAEFDKAFLQNEVGYHDAVIAAVTKTLLPAIQNAELEDLVTKVAPAFVAHRDAAKNMLDKMMSGM